MSNGGRESKPWCGEAMMLSLAEVACVCCKITS